MIICYDPVLKRPGCVLMAAVFQADTHLANRFDPKTWLLAPTANMGAFNVTEEQLTQLVAITVVP